MRTCLAYGSLVAGILCVIVGWFSIRVFTTEAKTAKGAIFAGLFGLAMLFCALRLIWHFMSL